MKILEDYFLLILFCGFIHLGFSPLVQAEGMPEHRLKAAFLYNFAIYTRWPNDFSESLNLCIYGEHSFGNELDKLQEKKVNQHFIKIKYTDHINNLADCQMVFISQSPMLGMKAILDSLTDKPILTVADNINQEGAVLSFILEDGKLKFDVNLVIAKNSGLSFSSQLLRFAREIHE